MKKIYNANCKQLIEKELFIYGNNLLLTSRKKWGGWETNRSPLDWSDGCKGTAHLSLPGQGAQHSTHHLPLSRTDISSHFDSGS